MSSHDPSTHVGETPTPDDVEDARPDAHLTGGDPAGDPAGDDVSDEELEAELAALDRTRPTPLQLAGGAPRELSWVLIVSGLLGVWAAVELVLSEIAVAGDPNAALACDFNPLIGCGSFITTWQAHALGVPNAVIGTVAFAALLSVGVMLLAGARPARWFWVALTAGATGAILSVFWFQFQAFFSIEMLCPYCLLVWLVTIPTFVNVLARSVQAGHVPAGDRLRRVLVADRWLIVGLWYAVVVVAAAVIFWDQWLLVLA